MLGLIIIINIIIPLYNSRTILAIINHTFYYVLMYGMDLAPWNLMINYQ